MRLLGAVVLLLECVQLVGGSSLIFVKDVEARRVTSSDHQINLQRATVPGMTVTSLDLSSIIIGGNGNIFILPLNSQSDWSSNLEQFDFPPMKCDAFYGEDPCYYSQRITQQNQDTIVCVAKKDSIEKTYFKLSGNELVKQSQLPEPLYCPIFGEKFLSYETNDAIFLLHEVSLRPKVEKRDTNGDIVISSPENTFRLEKVLQTFQYRGEIWFLYIQKISANDIVARIARVCTSDQGHEPGFHSEKVWTSLAYVTLQCTIPVKPAFTFPQLQDATFDTESQTLIATFTTYENAIPGSAICQYKFSDIQDSLAGERVNVDGVYGERKPETRRCSFDQSLKTPEILEQLTREQEVKDPLVAAPIFTFTRQSFLLLNIETEMLGSSILMIYATTTDGQLLKIALDSSTDQVTWIEANQVAEKESITDIHVSDNYLIVRSEDSLAKFPKSSCQQMLNCRDCWNLGDPRCYWSSSGCLSRRSTGSEFMFKLPERSKADSCPEEPVETPSEVSPVLPEENPKIICTDCVVEEPSVGDASSQQNPSPSVQQEDLSGSESGLLDGVHPNLKTGMIIGIPAFLIGILMGMGLLFAYAVCKAQCRTHEPVDTKDYEGDNVYETARYEAPLQPEGPRMFPSYFKAENQAMTKDYDFMGQIAQQELASGSPIPGPNGMLPNGMVPNGMLPNGMLPNGMVHNGYPPNYPPGMAPAPPPRPRNFSHSTSSDGMDAESNSLRTPMHEDPNRLLYQVPRGNNRFSAHEYETGDPSGGLGPRDSVRTAPENEHSSLRRGQTLPRNGHPTDQHVEDLNPEHNSLPRKQLDRRLSGGGGGYRPLSNAMVPNTAYNF